MVEPHFRVPLLSWPPRPLRSWVLRRVGRGQVYDVDPYGPHAIRRSFERAGLSYTDEIVRALRDLAATEGRGTVTKVLDRVPDGLLRAFSRLSPTMIFLLTPRKG